MFMVAASVTAGQISDISADGIIADLHHLSDVRLVPALADELINLNIFEAEDGRIVFPIFLSDCEQFFVLGRLVGMCFFQSFINSIFRESHGEDAPILTKDQFDNILRIFPPARMKKQFADYKRIMREESASSNVIRVAFSERQQEAPPTVIRSKKDYCVILATKKRRVVIHTSDLLPVKDYRVAASYIPLSLGEPDHKLDDTKAVGNQVLDLMLHAIRKTGFFIKVAQRFGHSTGWGCPPDGPYEISEPEKTQNENTLEHDS
ncbi:hypothetical protein [Oligoflexus sp.]|uniref:hypothetical protein n=1 Tax=Oligoflexus sp. TaxID=1971216 RepID=UPI002D7956D7|nr:hypothetical protein [Oligoflexus sp.]